ncbi:hypothetical protein SAMN04488029_3071 [Reichenbachiella faecimaris]|uniref:Transglutaminase-like superfamily protein n=1 Tax=Reichenbachiella faecimaris TaxID=692418 RepID=A0A1W2GJF5_REIFA|nr:hypothetical protein [Reichenbachiella faecimaris]SMD36790.1 hypothetical protein SAMN04488029_3071 [Reichenbachiella faecimaris]
MKIILLCLLFLSNFIKAQSLEYQIEIDNHRAGSFKQSTEVDLDTHTFTSLQFQLLTLSDTLQYKSDVHFVESEAGFLKSISWTHIFQDTLSREVRFDNGTTTPLNLSDSMVVYGPEKIRTLSLRRLDTLGAQICYQTFSPELNQVVEVKRELIDFSVEKAQKLKLVKESIGSQFTLSKYDKNFYLVQTSYPSPFGAIKLTRTTQVRPSQFFEPDGFDQGRLLSNIRFPDPNQISLVKLKIAGLDSLARSGLTHGNQKINSQDSSSVILINSNEKQSWIQSDTLASSMPEILWQNSNTQTILDSLIQDSLNQTEKLKALKSYARAQSYPHLTYYQLVLALQIPARLVYGYTYNQWFWSPKLWVEVALDGVWVTQDLTSEIETNSALKIALYKSGIGAVLNSSYLKYMSQITHIQVQSFTLNGKKHAASSQALPYYFENPVYENEGLGIRFNVPDGFSISDDGTKFPSPVFLLLKNSYGEQIKFFQHTSDQNMTESRAKRLITEHLNDSEIEINKGKKLNLWYGFKDQKGIVMVPQGKSAITITIQHEDPEFTIFVLTRKNLHLKY